MYIKCIKNLVSSLIKGMQVIVYQIDRIKINETRAGKDKANAFKMC